jgi:hypothetical protein
MAALALPADSHTSELQRKRINAIQNAKVKMQGQKPFAFCILPFALRRIYLRGT